MSPHPLAAIVDPNTLAAMGLRQLLQSIMPVINVHTYGSMSELKANHPEQYVHFFVAMSVVLEHRSFFQDYRRKTIVLTLSFDSHSQLPDFNSICVNVPEKQLLRSLLALQQHAHGGGRNLPPLPETMTKGVLTAREAEVMALIVQGHINKEIADRLNIGITTVMTHRKNIMDKLGIKSVSALTIYAVTHGYVDINSI